MLGYWGGILLFSSLFSWYSYGSRQYSSATVTREVVLYQRSHCSRGHSTLIDALLHPVEQQFDSQN